MRTATTLQVAVFVDNPNNEQEPVVLRKKISRLKYLYKIGGMSLLYGKLRYSLYGNGVLIEAGQLRPVYRKALQLLQERNGTADIGDYLEFGVSQGTSMQIMYQETEASNLQQLRLFGFDSFEGMPESADTEDDGAWSSGDFKQEIDDVKQRLSAKGIDWSRVHLEKGWFENTCTPDFLAKHRVEKVGVIMIDCDIYSSSKQALDFCEPLIKEHAVIVFDDWHSGDDLAARDLGEKKAFEEFLAKHPELSAEKIGNYSCFGYANGVVFHVSRRAK